MNEESLWKIADDFGRIADRVEQTYFSLDQSALLSCPSEFKTACWSRLVEGVWDENAARILLFVFRYAWEDRRDIEAAVELKRLFELAGRNDSELVAEVVHALTSGCDSQAKIIARQRGLPAGVFDEDPIGALEECFFGPDKSREDFLTGGLLLTGYRSAAIDSDPTGFLGAVLAIREAYAYLKAGQPSAASGSIEWLKPVLQSLEGRLTPDQREAIAGLLSEAALVAGERPESEICLRLWTEALRFVSTKGDDRARCHFGIGQQAQKQGKMAAAIRAYRAAMETPGICDQTLQKLIRLSLLGLRADLESDPRLLSVDGDFVAGSGVSRQLVDVVPRIMRDLDAGKHVADVDLATAVTGIVEWITSREAQGLPGTRSLSMLLTALKICLSMEDQARLPPYAQLMDLGDRCLVHGEEADRIEFHALKAEAIRRSGRQPFKAEKG